MKSFGGPAIFIDRNDINTDEIIPAKYLTEISKNALKPHLLEDLMVDGRNFAITAAHIAEARVVVSRANFGCGSSREHAVWAFEVNGIDVIIAQSFARIFRQNMFNCGILAIELEEQEIDRLFAIPGKVTLSIDVETETIVAHSSDTATRPIQCTFKLNDFDRQLVTAGGWLHFADSNY